MNNQKQATASEMLGFLLNRDDAPIFSQQKWVYCIDRDQIGIIEYCETLKTNFFFYFKNNERYSRPISKRDVKKFFLILRGKEGLPMSGQEPSGEM